MQTPAEQMRGNHPRASFSACDGLLGIGGLLQALSTRESPSALLIQII
jgi:hypothetical protein